MNMMGLERIRTLYASLLSSERAAVRCTGEPCLEACPISRWHGAC